MGVDSGETNPLRSRLCHQEETKFQRPSQDSGNLVVNFIPCAAMSETSSNCWISGMVQKQVTARGGWGRRPEAGPPEGRPPELRPPPWGLTGYCQLDPSHPAFVTCGSMILNHAGQCPGIYA